MSVKDGPVVISALLSMAGTSPLHTAHSDDMLELMEELDPKLDEPGFGREWFEQTGNSYPDAPTYEWIPQYCDLYLIETKTRTSILCPSVKWRR